MLDSYFKSSTTRDPRQTDFPGEGPVALSVRWDEKLRRITSARPGPALTSHDLAEIDQRIRRELLGPAGPERVVGIYLLSPRPVSGVWEYRDRLRLFAAPREGEVVHGGFKELYPLVLQARYRSSDLAQLDWVRASSAVLQWTWTLTALLRHRWRVEDRMTRFHWVRIPGERVVLAQEHVFSAVPLRSPDFYPTADLGLLGRTPLAEYFSWEYRFDAFSLPDDLEAVIAQLESLDQTDRQRLANAGFWMHHADVVEALNDAPAFVALITAVEALIERGPAPATSRFVQFLERTLNLREDDRAALVRLYEARSDIAHGWELVSALGRADMGPKWFDLGHKTRLLRDLLPVAVRNWIQVRSARPSAGEAGGRSRPRP